VQPKYGGYLQHFTAQDVAYFRDMPFSLGIPSHGVLVAHAGIVPEKPLEQQLLTDMLNVRSPHVSSLSHISNNWVDCPLRVHFLWPLAECRGKLASWLFSGRSRSMLLLRKFSAAGSQNYL
jgi:hypothetical protein